MLERVRSTIRVIAVATAGVLLVAASPEKAPPKTLDVAGMDPSVAACTDFYQHANGQWLASHPIPADRPRWGGFDELRQRNQNDLRDILERLAADKSAPKGSDERKLGDFYASCMDEAGIERAGITPIQPELARIEAIRDVPGLRSEIARLHSMGINVLFLFGSEEDRKDSSRMIAAALQGGLGLPERDYYLKNDEKSVELRKKYVAHVSKMLALSGEAPGKAAAEANTILAFETRLAQASQNNVDLRNPDKTYHPMTLETFSRTTPSLAWVAYFRDQRVPAGVRINVWQPDFFKAANGMLTSVPLSTWKTYLRWNVLSASAPLLSSAFVQENHEFVRKTLSGIPEIPPRWKRCVTAVDANMGMALGRIYVQEHFPPEAKRRVDELVTNLLAALDEDIDTLTWMSPATRKAAHAKVASFDKKLGYPDRWRDYSTLEIVPGDYVANIVAASQFESRRDIAKIGKPVDKTEWDMNPPEVNAQYRPPKNDIMFPAGILQPPFFYADGDDAINYGAIGGVIGHEITHGFDNSGRKFDAQGNQMDWWTAEDSKNFDARAKCIIDEFNSFVVEPGLNQNGELVQGEAIGDLGGATIAYRAFRKTLQGKPEPAPIDGLTADQRFFIANARVWSSNHRPEFARLIAKTNEHPLGKFRSLGIVSNMPEFARAFACKAGDAMVREPRCQIW